jgi:hypothetical protein
MKIKTDFVSNSSSTSFIYISPSEFTREAFFRAVGIEEESPLSSMFDDLFSALNDAIYNGDTIVSESELPNQTEKYPDFSVETIEKAKEALKKGNQVVIGRLDSDGVLPERFLCMESFEVESSDMLISAYDNYW